jgi:hypothetical protein
MSSATNVIEIKFTTKQVNDLKDGYIAFKGAAKQTLKDGVKLGLLMLTAKNKFEKVYAGMNVQTIASKFGKFMTDEIGISKSHRNLLIQIVSFDGLVKEINDGKVNSISEAKEYMKPSKDSGDESNEGESDESSEGASSNSKDFDKVLNILKQLDKLNINDKLIEKHILANASKVLGIEVKRENAEQTA